MSFCNRIRNIFEVYNSSHLLEVGVLGFHARYYYPTKKDLYALSQTLRAALKNEPLIEGSIS